MPYTPNSTWVDGSGGGTPISAARLNNLESGVTIPAWDTYTPSWTATGTAPAIGNGALTGKYFQRGKFVVVSLKMTIGSTTTFGTGAYRWSMPVSALATGSAALGTGYMHDASASSLWTCVAIIATGTTVYAAITATGGGYPVGQLIPFTWANTDDFNLTFQYEAA